jgi:hypothetical protein
MRHGVKFFQHGMEREAFQWQSSPRRELEFRCKNVSDDDDDDERDQLTLNTTPSANFYFLNH